MTSPQALRATAALLIGPCELVAMLSPAVARISAHGREYVVKKHASQTKHDREVHAYRRWTAALGTAAPELIAADSEALAIVTTVMPGQPRPDALTTRHFSQAGQLLRRFHDAEPPRALPWYRDWLRDRSAHWTARAAPFLPARDLDMAAGHLAALQEAPVTAGVPCHLDFQARNWLLGQAGDISLIDFEHSRIDFPLRDLVRLSFRVWPAHPDLRDAFLASYGQSVSAADADILRHLGALDALAAIARGHETADPWLIESGHSTLRHLDEPG